MGKLLRPGDKVKNYGGITIIEGGEGHQKQSNIEQQSFRGRE